MRVRVIRFLWKPHREYGLEGDRAAWRLAAHHLHDVAVIACMLSRGLPPKFGWEPIAMVTIIVSPMARETPRITAAAIPERAAGTTIFVAISRLVAPRA